MKKKINVESEIRICDGCGSSGCTRYVCAICKKNFDYCYECFKDKMISLHDDSRYDYDYSIEVCKECAEKEPTKYEIQLLRAELDSINEKSNEIESKISRIIEKIERETKK